MRMDSVLPSTIRIPIPTLLLNILTDMAAVVAIIPNTVVITGNADIIAIRTRNSELMREASRLSV
jgi:hypothetical protein